MGGGLGHGFPGRSRVTVYNGLLCSNELPLAATIVVDLNDCFFSIPLHADDGKRFALPIPSINNAEPAKRYEWVVLPQGMKISPAVCQMFVQHALKAVHETWPGLLIIHYMDELLLAAPTLPKNLYECVGTTLRGFGLKIGEDKTQHVAPYSYLGTKLTERMVLPQKLLVPTTRVATLHQLQQLVSTLQWLWQFIPITPAEFKQFTDLLHGDTNLAAPRELLAHHGRLLSLFLERVQGQGLARREVGCPIEAHILFQKDRAIIILHQGISGNSCFGCPSPVGHPFIDGYCLGQIKNSSRGWMRARADHSRTKPTSPAHVSSGINAGTSGPGRIL